MDKSGIYQITNFVTGKFYIGSAVKFKARWQQHRWYLNRGLHQNIRLQRSWSLHGCDAFKFTIVALVEDLSKLYEVEQLWLDYTKCYDDEIGYNLCPIAGSKLNVPMSQETKDKIGLANKGHTHGMTGRRHSEETRLKISEALNGTVNRNFNKWPHSRGYDCKCDECKNKRNEQNNNTRRMRC